jgi:hypothetical protein
MLRTVRKRTRGHFTGQKLTGSAKRVAEVFPTQAPGCEQAAVTQSISDCRSDREVQIQRERVSVFHDIVWSFNLRKRRLLRTIKNG